MGTERCDVRVIIIEQGFIPRRSLPVGIALDDAGTSYVAIYFRPACSIFPNSYNGKNDG